MDSVTSDGVRLWLILEGAGPAFVLIPGRGDSSDLVRMDCSGRLTDSGFSVLRYHPPATGLP